MYGTNTENSDRDFKEVYIPGGREILLQRVTAARSRGPVKAASEKNGPGDVDTQSFSVGKLFNMIAKGDIIGCEMIFTPPGSVIYKDPIYDTILAHKSIFLSKKVDGYVGYCRQQANKYGIRGSRIAAVRGLLKILDDEINITARGGHNKLSHIWGELSAYANETEHCSILDIPNGSTGQSMLHLECCDRKAPITITMGEAYRIYRRVFDEYGHRALAAEKNEGIDWKAISHAVRVGNQAIELLRTHAITFPRPEAADLLSIKRGERDYKEVAKQLDELLQEVMKASEESTLPDEPNWEAIDSLTINMHRKMLVSEFVDRG